MKKKTKNKKEKETLRESAARLKKDLEAFIELMEKEGGHLSPEEFKDFEDKQFRHIISKIADSIIDRIGEQEFREVSGKLKKKKITLEEAAKELGINMGDLVLILEARKVFTEEALQDLLSGNRKP